MRANMSCTGAWVWGRVDSSSVHSSHSLHKRPAGFIHSPLHKHRGRNEEKWARRRGKGAEHPRWARLWSLISGPHSSGWRGISHSVCGLVVNISSWHVKWWCKKNLVFRRVCWAAIAEPHLNMAPPTTASRWSTAERTPLTWSGDQEMTLSDSSVSVNHRERMTCISERAKCVFTNKIVTLTCRRWQTRSQTSDPTLSRYDTIPPKPGSNCDMVGTERVRGEKTDLSIFSPLTHH